ncbi:MAG: type II secretion system F family protein [bacterium]
MSRLAVSSFSFSRFFSPLCPILSFFPISAISALKLGATKPLNKRQISRFCSQLKTLLSSGVSLIESLQITSKIIKRKELSEIIDKVSEGQSLAEAMKGQFPPLVVSSVESAEQTGSLEHVLERLAKEYENRAEVEEKIMSALIYPVFVITLCLVSLIVLLVFVLPGFKGLFADLDAELPLFTRLIIGGGDVFAKVWYVPIALSLSLGYYLPNKQRLLYDRLLMRLKWFQREQIILTFRNIGSLLQGGVPIMEGLDSTIKAIKNSSWQDNLQQISRSIENGEPLSAELAKYSFIPEEAVQMVAVGENSGRLAEMLISIANFYEQERTVFLKRFTTMLEPIMTLFVGLVVGIIAMAMFLPMINMISQIQ